MITDPVAELAAKPLVLIVDDDAEVREAVHALLRSVGIEATCFASPCEMLHADIPDRPGCMVLDVRMPGASGLDLQEHLTATGRDKPVVFLSAHGDVPMTVKAMKAGATDFLVKPVRDQALLDAVATGIERDIERRAAARFTKGQVRRLETLTPREREVMREVVDGRLNKQIAYDLGISEVTVKLHRSNVMRKMQAASIGGLIRLWEALPAEIRRTASPARDVSGERRLGANDHAAMGDRAWAQTVGSMGRNGVRH